MIVSRSKKLSIICLTLVYISSNFIFCNAETEKLMENGRANLDRSFSSSFDPVGFLKRARQMMGAGVHKLRENLHEGVKVAHHLKDDMDEGVAHLIGNSKSSNANLQPDQRSSSPFDFFQKAREGMLGGILRFMGYDSSSIGMVVLNVLIFFAEMVTSNMIGKDANMIPDTRALKANIFEWMMTGHNKKVDEFVNGVKSKELPDTIINLLQNKTGEQTACLQLLICKMSPFIWGIQKSADEMPKINENEGRGLMSILSTSTNSLFEKFPDKKSFASFGERCENKFPSCKLLKFSNKKKADKNKL